MNKNLTKALFDQLQKSMNLDDQQFKQHRADALKSMKQEYSKAKAMLRG